MLSVKRLLQIIVILFLVTIAFLLFILSNTTQKTLHENSYADINIELQENEINNIIPVSKYLVVGDLENKTERVIQENIVSALESMKLPFEVKTKIEEADLIGHPSVIFTDPEVSECASLPLIGNFISSGGRVLFLGGIPENDDDSYLNPVWGIVEKGSKVETKGFHILKNFLPYGEVSVDYSGYNASTILHLKENVKIFMTSEENIPIVYSYAYKLGKAVVINGTFLDNKFSSGIFSAALGELQDELIYPILGTKSVFLDGFPTVYNGNDQNSFDLYGRSVEAFSRDVLWPELLSSSSKYDLKYTANILGIIPKQYNIDLTNERLLVYLSNQILTYSGEIGIAADQSESVDTASEQALNLYNYLKKDFVNYKFNSYSLLYGKTNSQTMQAISSQFGGIKVLRGVYEGEEKTQQVQNFGVEDDYITFPTLTSGYTVDGGTYFNFLSTLSEHGAVSHSFNIENLVSTDTEKSNWNALETSYEQLNKDFFSKTMWLKPAALSEAAQIAKAYTSLEMNTNQIDNNLQVECNHFMKGQAFFLRSNRTVKEVKGGSFTKINDVYTVITALNPDFTIIYN